VPVTSEDFAALERRLAAVPAGWSQDRHGVLDLLAECRALRAFAPPALAALEQVSWVFETLDGLRAEAGPDGRLATKLRHHLATARGHLLAALGARPPGVECDHDAGDRQLDKVLQDAAELERLRRPPDAAALLTAAERGEMLRRVERDLPQSGYAGGQCLRLLRHAEAQDALVRELYAVVADLHEDHGPAVAAYERGRAEGREQAARKVEGWVGANVNPPVHPDIVPSIRALGPCRPPLPPQEAEREAVRLREALRGLAAVADASSDVLLDANILGWAGELRAGVLAARKALRGEVP
jgi:hypothetical protein